MLILDRRSRPQDILRGRHCGAVEPRVSAVLRVRPTDGQARDIRRWESWSADVSSSAGWSPSWSSPDRCRSWASSSRVVVAGVVGAVVAGRVVTVGVGCWIPEAMAASAALPVFAVVVIGLLDACRGRAGFRWSLLPAPRDTSRAAAGGLFAFGFESRGRGWLAAHAGELGYAFVERFESSARLETTGDHDGDECGQSPSGFRRVAESRAVGVSRAVAVPSSWRLQITDALRISGSGRAKLSQRIDEIFDKGPNDRHATWYFTHIGR